MDCKYNVADVINSKVFFIIFPLFSFWEDLKIVCVCEKQCVIIDFIYKAYWYLAYHLKPNHLILIT